MPSRGVVRYAVVGLGHIAQVAVLPAFAHAKNAKLVAVVSGDAAKRRAAGRRFKLEATYDYDEFEACLDTVDAVYIALPNHQHAEYTIRAANAGVHVLCEKPMAVTVEECERMIAACADNGVKLMIAYRLHFEEINLGAVELVRKGRIGDPKYFSSSLLDAGPARRHPHQGRPGRRHAVRHRRLLHQRRALPVPRRAEGGRGGLGQQRRRPSSPRSTSRPRRSCASRASGSRRSSPASTPPTCPSTASSAPRGSSMSTRLTNMPAGSATR